MPGIWSADEDALVFNELVANLDNTKNLREIFEDIRKNSLTRSIKALYARYTKYLTQRVHLIEYDNDVKCKLVVRYKIPLLPEQREYFEALGATFNDEGLVLPEPGPAPAAVKRTREDSPKRAQKKPKKTTSSSSASSSNDDEEEGLEDEEQPQSSSGSRYANRRQTRRDQLQAALYERDGAVVAEHEQEGEVEQEHLEDQEQQQTNGVLPPDVLTQQNNIEPFFSSLREVVKAGAKDALSNIIANVNATPANVGNDSTASLKKFVDDLQKLITRINSPVLEDIEHRIESAVASLNRRDEQVPVASIYSMLDITLTMFNH